MKFPYHLQKNTPYWRFRETDGIWYYAYVDKPATYTAEDVVDRSALGPKRRGPPHFNSEDYVFFKLPKRAHPYNVIAVLLKTIITASQAGGIHPDSAFSVGYV